MPQSFKFHRTERLKNFKLLNELFKTGRSFSAYPLRVVYIPISKAGVFPAEFALTVPKRKFNKAAHRNRIRRKVREAYRLNKHNLYEILSEKEERIALMVMYVAKEDLPYKEIEKAMRKLIKKFGKQA